MKKITLVSSILFLLVIGSIFKNWFLPWYIIGGDWPFFFPENIQSFSFLPPLWNSVQGNGFGGPTITYALDSYLYITAWLFTSLFSIPWPIIYKVFWFGMFIFLAIFSAISLQKKLFPKLSYQYYLLGSLIYVTNTYILMVVGGGQMGFALGYAIAPLVLNTFIALIDKKDRDFFTSLLAGIVLSLQLLFDFRVFYITLIVIGLYVIVHLYNVKYWRNAAIYGLVIPFVVVLLSHAYWLLPLVFTGKGTVAQLGSGYTTTDAVTFFSFATFENAFGLLHPNWPENIFGKVGFMKAEFLLLPLLAFSSLLFLTNKTDKKIKTTILYACFIALFGIFLAKGANDPWGISYTWFFEHIPGFVMFRDPTKFYILTALGYTLLIPISLWLFTQKASQLKNKTIKKFFVYFSIPLFLVVWVFLIHEAVLGQLGGTFRQHAVPEEYNKLKNMLVNEKQFSRTMWLPKTQRYMFVNQNHPAVEGNMVLQATNSAAMVNRLKQKDTKKKLQGMSIKYLIIPADSEKEIFLKDRRYNDAERRLMIAQLSQIRWLKRDPNFKELAVYKLDTVKERFWMEGTRSVVYDSISDTTYKLTISSGAAEKLIFNESYSPHWEITVNNTMLNNVRFGIFNSYVIPESKKPTEAILTYSPIIFSLAGRVISLVSILIILYCLYKYKVRKRRIDVLKSEKNN